MGKAYFPTHFKTQCIYSNDDILQNSWRMKVYSNPFNIVITF